MAVRFGTTRLTIPSILVLTALTGCAQNFRPGPGMTDMDLSMAKGRCGLVSRQHSSGFSAQGSTGFVLGAALGNAIGEGVRTSSDFNDCMLANGAVVDNGKPALVAAALPAPQPDPAGPPALPPSQPLALSAAFQPTALPPLQFAGSALYPAETLAARRARERAESWMQAETVLNRSDRRSRDLFLVLCGGDDSSCAMAAALRR